MIYSFYDPPVEERLKDHINLALSNINAEGRLIRQGMKLTDDFLKILRLSIIFHDFGKVVFNQHAFREGKRLTFPGHEVISCWAVYRHFNVGQYLKDEITGRKLIALSVLMHHHPMELRERINILKKNEMEVDEETFNLFWEELNDIYIDNVRLNRVNVSEIAWETQRIYVELWKEIWMNSSPKIRKIFLLNLQGLVACDYTSANKLRGGDKGFINVIRKFNDSFMSSRQGMGREDRDHT
ncbi:CRISPR-associated endonuclease Cas3-HD [Sulfuracidifex tepidarius]|uniref:CRISPR-associated endonuclease Cas3-HD n=1 Tax=Sulfuracidifex tepidarius TaxID=1294262 RepID=A0A510DXN9_9CREN|nr:HD domain-containing protein [Sulfuracidifex tepidarius]BBG24974.1 CRISPR-associated endonuclease Cas3-HD [Sulfuracidifex tepidarius]